MSARVEITQSELGPGTFWDLRIVGGHLMPTEVETFIADLRDAQTKCLELNQLAKQRRNQ